MNWFKKLFGKKEGDKASAQKTKSADKTYPYEQGLFEL